MQGLTRFLGRHAAPGLRPPARALLYRRAGAVGAEHPPDDIYWWVERTIRHIYDMGFAFFTNSLDYLIAGALIVVPLFIISRLLRFGGRRRVE